MFKEYVENVDDHPPQKGVTLLTLWHHDGPKYFMTDSADGISEKGAKLCKFPDENDYYVDSMILNMTFVKVNVDTIVPYSIPETCIEETKKIIGKALRETFEETCVNSLTCVGMNMTSVYANEWLIPIENDILPHEYGLVRNVYKDDDKKIQSTCALVGPVVPHTTFIETSVHVNKHLWDTTGINWRYVISKGEWDDVRTEPKQFNEFHPEMRDYVKTLEQRLDEQEQNGEGDKVCERKDEMNTKVCLLKWKFMHLIICILLNCLV